MLPTCSFLVLLCRRALLLCVLLASLPLQAAGLSLPGLAGDEQDVALDAWSAVTWLPERGGPWTLDQARARRAELVVPTTPRANLGVRREAVWLQLDLHTGPVVGGHWLLDIDYPSLDRIEVYLLRDGELQQTSLLGDHLPLHQRPLRNRSPNVALLLAPAASYELWLRVETTSSMILPVRLMSPAALARSESAMQLYEGMAGGIGLCLAIYALAYWVSMRESTFLWYAFSVMAITAFFYALEGVGPQHLWGDSEWMTRNGAPFLILLALVGGLGFLDRSLKVRELMPWVAWTMYASALVAALAALAFALGALDYRGAHLTGTVLGPLPIVLGLPVAWRRARQGDRAALYILIGWGVYAVGILIMALLLRGALEATPLTLHAFQAAGVLEMVMWMRVLGVRIEALRHEAEHGRRERARLLTMAHTDALTGLANRRGLMAALADRLPDADPQRLLVAYVLDLDGFKAVNDRLGHDAGDELLREVASRLRAAVRSDDLVARLGGDEFVVLVDGLQRDEDAAEVGQHLLSAVLRPITVRGTACEVGATIGYALAPLDAGEEAALLKLADAAMYAGKQAGKGRVRRGQVAFGPA